MKRYAVMFIGKGTTFSGTEYVNRPCAWAYTDTVEEGKIKADRAKECNASIYVDAYVKDRETKKVIYHA